MPQGHWSDVANHTKLLERVAKTLKIKTLDDWYNVSTKDFVKYGGARVCNMCVKENHPFGSPFVAADDAFVAQVRRFDIEDDSSCLPKIPLHSLQFQVSRVNVEAHLANAVFVQIRAKGILV